MNAISFLEQKIMLKNSPEIEELKGKNDNKNEILSKAKNVIYNQQFKDKRWM